MSQSRARSTSYLIASVLLLTLSACSEPTATSSDGQSSGPDGEGRSASASASPSEHESDLASCDELDVAQAAVMQTNYPGGTRAAITLDALAPLPAVTLPVADCAWQTRPAAGSDISGEFWEMDAYYLTDDTTVFDDLEAQLASAGCYDKSADGTGEWLCNVDDIEIPEGWVFYLADYPLTLGDGYGTASELSITYQKG